MSPLTPHSPGLPVLEPGVESGQRGWEGVEDVNQNSSSGSNCLTVSIVIPQTMLDPLFQPCLSGALVLHPRGHGKSPLPHG